MRQFYLTKNSSGYYRIKFPDPATGKIISGKSTHSKDLFEATCIATEWLKHGMPSVRSNARSLNEPLQSFALQTVSQKQNIQSFVNNLSQNEINDLIVLLAQKIQGGVVSNSQSLQAIVQNVNANLQTVQVSVPETLGNAMQQKLSVVAKERIPLVTYMIDFWDFEKSKYLAEEKAYGRQISERHAKEMRGLAVRYWKPYFGDAQVAKATT